MSILDRFRRKPELVDSDSEDTLLRQRLVELIMNILRDKDGRIRAEDAISAAATIVAERCIDAAGDYELRNHMLTPGSRAFSTRVNELISGDTTEKTLDRVPKASIIGWLRNRLDKQQYADSQFPPLSAVFQNYAAGIGDPKDWGKVPLSVSQDHLPFLLPLRVGYETRDRVDEIFLPISDDKMRCLRIATESLADLLNMVASVIDHAVALALAIETINGISKTAPMTTKAMQQVQ